MSVELTCIRHNRTECPECLSIGSLLVPAWEAEQRASTTCAGCQQPKSHGLVVCWSCFKGTNGRPAFKYWQDSWPKWLAMCQNITSKLVTKGDV
jgi:hypothetical protein